MSLSCCGSWARTTIPCARMTNFLTHGSLCQSVRFLLRCSACQDECSITKFQTGGPDGDLGSNEILVSKDKTIVPELVKRSKKREARCPEKSTAEREREFNVRKVSESCKAIVDGSGVVYDPHGIDRAELRRLAKMRVPISQFNRSMLKRHSCYNPLLYLVQFFGHVQYCVNVRCSKNLDAVRASARPEGFLVTVEETDVALPDGSKYLTGAERLREIRRASFILLSCAIVLALRQSCAS